MKRNEEKKKNPGTQQGVSEHSLLGDLNQFNLVNTPSNFRAGQISQFVDNWCRITSDKEILDWVLGVHIDFSEEFVQSSCPSGYQFTSVEEAKINEQLITMWEKGIIQKAEPSEGQFISNIFCRPKKDGSVRIILNLKQLNTTIEYNHFKMETLNHAVQLMTRNCYMASIDLKDAYYSVPIAPEDRRYPRFIWQGQLYQFTCLPNGLSEAPRKFTKLLKPPFACLRSKDIQTQPI